MFLKNFVKAGDVVVFLASLVSALDDEFSFFKGKDDSCNGLQIDGNSDVGKVAVACDAVLETIEKAAFLDADLLIVHHGMFWNSDLPRRVDVPCRRRLQACFDAGLSVYAQHLPLDLHPTLGNNVLVGKALGLSGLQPACEYFGAKMAFKGNLAKPVTLDVFAKTVEKSVGAANRVLPFGSKIVKSVAVCSGSGGFCASYAKDDGFDTLVVGEFKHSDYHDAKEAGVNVVEAGHYNTEVFGVQTTGRWLEEKFGVPWAFVDAPTGF